MDTRISKELLKPLRICSVIWKCKTRMDFSRLAENPRVLAAHTHATETGG
jgi:hypothetical protein